MVFIIPLIGLLLMSTGGAILVWYNLLSAEDKKKYEKAVFSILKQKMQERGIAIDFDDTKESLEAKAKRKGLSNEEIKRIIDESAEEGKAGI
jgi:hypothetical protein